MKTLKTYLSVIIFILSIGTGVAQTADSNNYVRNETVNPNPHNNLFYAGFGLGGYYSYSGPSSLETPSFTVGYDRTVLNHIGPGSVSLGAFLSYKGISSGYIDAVSDYQYTQNWSYYIAGIRSAYTLKSVISPDIDLYGGFMLGYYFNKFRFTSTDPDYLEPKSAGYSLSLNNYPNYIAPGIFAGARSRISNKSSMWIELGYGYQTIAFGICTRI